MPSIYVLIMYLCYKKLSDNIDITLELRQKKIVIKIPIESRLIIVNKFITKFVLFAIAKIEDIIGSILHIINIIFIK